MTSKRERVKELRECIQASIAQVEPFLHKDKGRQVVFKFSLAELELILELMRDEGPSCGYRVVPQENGAFQVRGEGIHPHTEVGFSTQHQAENAARCFARAFKAGEANRSYQIRELLEGRLPPVDTTDAEDYAVKSFVRKLQRMMRERKQEGRFQDPEVQDFAAELLSRANQDAYPDSDRGS